MFFVLNKHSTTVISSHHTSGAANDKASQLDKKRTHSRGDHLVIETDDKLAIGQPYPDLVKAHEQEVFDRNAIYLMCDVLENQNLDRVASHLAAMGLTLEQLRERYAVKAQAKLDETNARSLRLAEQKARANAVRNELAKGRSEITYTFPAVSGTQAGQVYYCAQIPFAALVRLFTFDDECVPAENRAQRTLNSRRAAAIGDYIINNAENYVLPALTASVSAEMAFEPFSVPGAAERLGLLHIPVEATMLINDGQHRRAGIELAIKQMPSLKQETVSVILFFDQGLKRSQQMFADINTQQVKPSNSINALYDHRNPFNTWALQMIRMVDGLPVRIDFENASVGAKSLKLWSLVGFKRFLTLLTGINADNVESWTQTSNQRQALSGFIQRFFKECAAHIPHWAPMLSGLIDAPSVRKNLVIGHQVWLEALAIFARYALFAGQADAPDGVIDPTLANWSILEALVEVEPSKGADTWHGRCVILGRMQKTSDGVKSTAAQLVKFAKLPLPPALEEVERRITRSITA